MRHSGVLLGALLLFALRAGAQTTAPTPLLPDSPSPTASVLVASNTAAEPNMLPPKPEPADSGPGKPQEVQGIYGDYYTQVFVGATYLRFFEFPGTQQNLGGPDISLAYYMKPWIAADIETFDALGTDSGQTANFYFFGGGPRVRWQTSSGIEFWGHALGGFAHYSPTTIYGGTLRGAFEGGGGVDFGPAHRRWVYRVQADAVASFLFNVHQVSPRVAAGVVLKF